MISNDFLKRTPVRLAGAFTILFALTVVALVAVLYITLVSELDAAIRQHVEEMSDTLKAIDRQQGFDDLAAVVAEEAESVRDFDSIFLLRGGDGSFRAGNIKNVRLFNGWGELDRAMAADGGRQGQPRRPFLRDMDARLQGPSPRRRQRQGDPRGAPHSAARPRMGAGRHVAACRRFGDVSGAARATEDRRVRDDASEGQPWGDSRARARDRLA